jgi:hypothetical protein
LGHLAVGQIWVVAQQKEHPGGEQFAEKRIFWYPAPEGTSDFAGLTVSLKRYPNTKLEFPRSLSSHSFSVNLRSFSVRSHSCNGICGTEVVPFQNKCRYRIQ